MIRFMMCEKNARTVQSGGPTDPLDSFAELPRLCVSWEATQGGYADQVPFAAFAGDRLTLRSALTRIEQEETEPCNCDNSSFDAIPLKFGVSSLTPSRFGL
jgi:hypothetical protein